MASGVDDRWMGRAGSSPDRPIIRDCHSDSEIAESRRAVSRSCQDYQSAVHGAGTQTKRPSRSGSKQSKG